MIRAGRWLGLLVMVLMVGGYVLAQDKATAKAKGQLPPNWSKLGLSDEQRQKVYSIQTDYRAKIEVLEDQIKKLRKEEGGELSKILTDSQKARLREIIAAKSLSDPPGKEDKKTEKPAAEKKTEKPAAEKKP